MPAELVFSELNQSSTERMNPGTLYTSLNVLSHATQVEQEGVIEQDLERNCYNQHVPWVGI